MKVFTLFRPTQQVVSPNLKITPYWLSSKNRGSRFKETDINDTEFSSLESVNYVQSEPVPATLETPFYQTPVAKVPTYKEINPYTRSHCLAVASYMLQELINMTHESADFNHIGLTNLTYESLNSLKHPCPENNDVLIKHCFPSNPASKIKIKCQSMIGSGAVSVVLKTDFKSSTGSLAAKIQTAEFHLSLREIYIAWSYLRRRINSTKINRTNTSWLTPTLLVFVQLTESTHHEGSVSFKIPESNIFDLIGVNKEDTGQPSYWYSKKKKPSNALCASILFSPTSLTYNCTLLDLSNAIHHSSQTLRQKLKSLANEDVILFLTYQLLALISSFHSAGIIHADVKPDNFLLYTKPDTEPLLHISGFDYGRSIDVKGYYNNLSWFTSSCHAKGFQSCEMLLGLPWSFGIDYYGIACILHVLISGRYLSVPFEPPTSSSETSFNYKKQTKIVIDALMDPIIKKNYEHQNFWKSLYTTLVTFDSHSIPGAPNQDKKSISVCEHYCDEINTILYKGHKPTNNSSSSLIKRIDTLSSVLQQYER